MPRALPDSWVLPALEPRNQAFFRAGRIVIQCCAACDTLQHPPEDVCRGCGAAEFRHRESRGTGTVYSFTVADHPVHPLLGSAVPYVIVLVAIDDLPGIRIVGNLVGCPPDSVRIGLPVRATFVEVPDPDGGEPLRLPQWEADAGRKYPR